MTAKRGPRTDHQTHTAIAILSIARERNTWKEIAQEIGISMRATYKLLKELEDSGHITAFRPDNAKTHNTKPVTYNLLDDLGNFVYYARLIKGFYEEKFKEFMLTNYYIKTADNVCYLISSHAHLECNALFLVYTGDKENPDTKDAEHGFFELLESMGNENADTESSIEPDKDLQMNLWPINNEWSYYPEIISKWLDEDLTVNNYVKYSSQEWVDEPDNKWKYLETVFGIQDRILPDVLDSKNYMKFQENTAILIAVVNDGVFYKALYRIMTTFPDSVFSIIGSIEAMILKSMPNGFQKDNVDMLFNRSDNEDIPDFIDIKKVSSKTFYVVMGDIASKLFLEGLNCADSGNAVMPDRFFEQYILKDLRTKT